MVVAIVILWFLIGSIAIYSNRDLISPAKYYLVNLALFFGEIVTGDYVWEVELTILLLVLFAALVVLLEKNSLRRAVVESKRQTRAFRVRPYGIAILWVLSLIPIASQLYLVISMGGFYGYASAAKSSVVEMRGLGVFFTIVRMLPVLNMCYLYLILVKRNNIRLHMSLYSLHLLLVVGLGLFAHSRSAIVYPIIFAVIMFHYSFRRIAIAYWIGLLVAAIFSTAFLGVVREIYSFEKDVIVDFSNRDSMFLWSGFSYGLVGVEALVSMGVRHPYMGWTYLTVFTNFVPRFIWPGKPNPGGIIFTREYLSDQWGGTSVATPGLMGEAMMNFGVELGMWMGLLILFGFFYWLVRIYGYSSTLNLRRASMCDRFLVVKYVFFLNYANGLLAGEFTNTTIGVIIPIFYIYVLESVLFQATGGGNRIVSR